MVSENPLKRKADAMDPGEAFPARKRTSILTMDLSQVEVRIGLEERPFMVYKELICYYSRYFQNAFEGGFKEAEERSITLSDVTEGVFRLFLYWLQGQDSRPEMPKPNENSEAASKPLGTAKKADSKKSSKKSNEILEELRALFAYLPPRTFLSRHGEPATSWIEKDISSTLAVEDVDLTMFLDLYVFADQYDTPSLRHDIMAILSECSNRQVPMFTYDLVNKAYDNLLRTSALCKYILWDYVLYWTPKCDSPRTVKLREELPKEFTLDIMCINTQLLSTQRRDPDIAEGVHRALTAIHQDPCTFHDHPNREEYACCRDRRARDASFLNSFLRAILQFQETG